MLPQQQPRSAHGTQAGQQSAFESTSAPQWLKAKPTHRSEDSESDPTVISKGSTASDHDQGLGALQDVSTDRFMGLDAGAEQLSEWLQLDDDLEDYMVDVVGDQVTAKVRGLMVEVVGCDELHEGLLEECYKVLKNAVSKPLQQATDVLSSLDDIKNTFKISLQNVLDQHGGLVRRPK